MSSPDLYSSAFQLILSLAVVLGVLFALLYFLKKMSFTPVKIGGVRNIVILENLYIGIKKQITVVKIPGALLILGVTQEHITLLTRITDPEIIKRVESDKERTNQSSFSMHMQKLSGGIFKGGKKE